MTADVDPTPTAADLRLDLGRLLVKALDTGLSEAGWRKLALAGCRRALYAEAELRRENRRGAFCLGCAAALLHPDPPGERAAVQFERLAEIEGRLHAAPPGPWQDGGPDKFTEGEPWTHCVLDAAGDLLAQVDCDHPALESHRAGHPGCVRARDVVALIIHAPCDLADLLAEVRSLRVERDRLAHEVALCEAEGEG